MVERHDAQSEVTSGTRKEQKSLLRQRFSSTTRVPTSSGRCRSGAFEQRLHTVLAAVSPRLLVAYEPIADEIDVRPVVDAYAEAGIPVFVPNWAGGAKSFVHEQTGAPLGHFEERLAILVPGIAFDGKGVRLGRGGGWYDQVLIQYPTAVRIGCAHDYQVVESLPQDEWDVAMHYVVTTERSIVADPVVTPTGECPHVWT